MWVKRSSAGIVICSIALSAACSSNESTGGSDGGLDGGSSSGGSSGKGDGGAGGKGAGGSSGSASGGHAGVGNGGKAGSAGGGATSAGGARETDAATPLDAGGGDAGPTPCGACKAGELCVEHLLEGGAVFLADAGRCPPGRVLVPGGPDGICVQEPTYACETLPASCSGSAHCGCARSLCGSANLCDDVSPALMRCTLQAP